VVSERRLWTEEDGKHARAAEPTRRPVADPPRGASASVGDALRVLQRTFGNRAVARYVRGIAGSTDAGRPAPPDVRRAIDSPGEPIPAGIRGPMEAAFGRGFGTVQVHTGPLAREAANAVDAPAFSVGEHIVVGEDVDPESPLAIAGLAHELTHVVQQPSGHPADLVLGSRNDPAEREAEALPATLAGAVTGRWDKEHGRQQVKRFAREHDAGQLRDWGARLGEGSAVVRERTALGEVRRLWGHWEGQKRSELETDPAKLTDMPTFVRNIFEFFYPGMEPPEHSEAAAELAGKMLWDAIEGSRMMDKVPRPGYGKLGVVWLAKNAVQMAFRVGMDEGIYVAVRNVVAAKYRTDFELLKAGVTP
jgi:hypothetical protein